MRVPPRRSPDLPPWGQTECEHCALPVRLVRVATQGAPVDVEVCMRPASIRDPRADVAAMVVGNRLHGYRLARLRPVQPGYTVWIRHAKVCTVKPEVVQLELPEGDLT